MDCRAYEEGLACTQVKSSASFDVLLVDDSGVSTVSTIMDEAQSQSLQFTTDAFIVGGTSGIYAVPKGGGAPLTLASGQYVSATVFQGDWVVTQAAGVVTLMRPDGSESEVLASNASVALSYYLGDTARYRVVPICDWGTENSNSVNLRVIDVDTKCRHRAVR